MASTTYVGRGLLDVHLSQALCQQYQLHFWTTSMAELVDSRDAQTVPRIGQYFVSTDVMAGISCVAKLGGLHSTAAEVGRSAVNITNDGDSSGCNAVCDGAYHQDKDFETVVPQCMGNRKLSTDEDAANDELRPIKQRRQSNEAFRHENRNLEHSKFESKTLRKQALETIRSCWQISSEQLMDVPYAPEQPDDLKRPRMKPLYWNENLLKVLARLALMTRGSFTGACAALKDAFECESRLNRATQLTDYIVDKAIKALQHDVAAQAPTKCRKAAVEPESLTHHGIDKSLVVKLPGSPQSSTSTVQSTKAAPETTLQTPPRSQCVKSDYSGSAAQPKFFGCDDGPLAHEDLLVYKMRLDLCEAELNCRATRARLDEAKRLRGNGDSGANAVIV